MTDLKGMFEMTLQNVWKKHFAIQIEKSPGNLLLQDTIYKAI